MSGFANQIIGGLSKLIRPAIQSPNYAPSSAGWTINQDGSAEFNDATFRGTVVINAAGTALLVYDGAPAAGKLILSLSAFAGTDAYGNNYPGGICTTNANGTASNAGYTSRWNPTDPLSGVQPLSLAFLNNLQCGLISQPELFVQSATSDLNLQAGPGNFIRALADNIFIGQAGAALSKIQFGAGLPGGYYFELVEIGNGQSIPANASTFIDVIALKYLYSDYGGKFSGVTNEWTCPLSSLYQIGAFIEYSTVPTGITRNGIYIQQSDDGGATWRNIDYNETGSNLSSCNTPPIYIPQGSLIRFIAWHNGTTAGTLSSNCFASAMRFL